MVIPILAAQASRVAVCCGLGAHQLQGSTLWTVLQLFTLHLHRLGPSYLHVFGIFLLGYARKEEWGSLPKQCVHTVHPQQMLRHAQSQPLPLFVQRRTQSSGAPDARGWDGRSTDGRGAKRMGKVVTWLTIETMLASLGVTCTTGAQHRTLKERPILSGYRWQF